MVRIVARDQIIASQKSLCDVYMFACLQVLTGSTSSSFADVSPLCIPFLGFGRFCMLVFCIPLTFFFQWFVFFLCHFHVTILFQLLAFGHHICSSLFCCFVCFPDYFLAFLLHKRIWLGPHTHCSPSFDPLDPSWSPWPSMSTWWIFDLLSHMQTHFDLFLSCFSFPPVITDPIESILIHHHPSALVFDHF